MKNYTNHLFVCRILTYGQFAVALLTASTSFAQREQSAPALLETPFSAASAKAKQKEWADWLQQDITKVNSIGIMMVLIPPGEFSMGSPDSEVGVGGSHKPNELQHSVVLTRTFLISSCPVRVGDFRRFVEGEGYRTDAEKSTNGGWGFVEDKLRQDTIFTWRNPGFEQGDDHPVVNVSWNDAVAFCNWLSKQEGKSYRLATEAEWEYACRAGTSTAFNFGDTCNGSEANCNGTFPYGTDKRGPYLGKTCVVGHYNPNAFGLYDMHGNVNQWCSDWYIDETGGLPNVNPAGPASGSRRVIRGGSWYVAPIFCRSADRGGAEPASVHVDTGFRIVCAP